MVIGMGADRHLHKLVLPDSLAAWEAAAGKALKSSSKVGVKHGKTAVLHVSCMN